MSYAVSEYLAGLARENKVNVRRGQLGEYIIDRPAHMPGPYAVVLRWTEAAAAQVILSFGHGINIRA